MIKDIYLYNALKDGLISKYSLSYDNISTCCILAEDIGNIFIERMSHTEMLYSNDISLDLFKKYT